MSFLPVGISVSQESNQRSLLLSISRQFSIPDRHARLSKIFTVRSEVRRNNREILHIYIYIYTFIQITKNISNKNSSTSRPLFFITDFDFTLENRFHLTIFFAKLLPKKSIQYICSLL